MQTFVFLKDINHKNKTNKIKDFNLNTTEIQSIQRSPNVQ